MTPRTPVPPVDHPYEHDLEREHALWDELVDLCAGLPPGTQEVPGYYVDPAWSVKDMVAHVGSWLAQGKSRIEQIIVGTYVREDLDIDAMNEVFLEALREQPWTVVWTQANAARTLMLGAWFAVTERSSDADWWMRKVGPDHYEEHLGRLRSWARELHEGAR
jgi:hypothetical protein